VAAGLLAAAVFAAPATAGGAAKGAAGPCELLKRAEIEDAFGLETGRGEVEGLHCAWDVDDELVMTAELITDETAEILDNDAKGLFEEFSDDLSGDKVGRLGDRAVYGETSYGSVSLLVLEGNRFLFLDFGDVEGGGDVGDTIAAERLRKGMVKLGKRALKRL
jgi:hypothetical protein